MSKQVIVPCLWFDVQAQAACDFYMGVFGRGRVLASAHYPESIDNPSRMPRGSVLSVDFEVAGMRFTAINGGPLFAINRCISFFVFVESAPEANKIFSKLADEGTVLMPIGAYAWSSRYGWVQDRFGVSWQVIVGARPAHETIVPCLMFSGPQRGRAEEAMRDYMQLFGEGQVDLLERYPAGGATEGMIEHARFTLAGQSMVVMDSHEPHELVFNEALSLMVMCEDQSQIDRFWSAMSEEGQAGPCGWLKDRYGLSWQIVPTSISRWMSSTDTAARDRAFAAMLKMGKLDIASLEAAFLAKV